MAKRSGRKEVKKINKHVKQGRMPGKSDEADSPIYWGLGVLMAWLSAAITVLGWTLNHKDEWQRAMAISGIIALVTVIIIMVLLSKAKTNFARRGHAGKAMLFLLVAYSAITAIDGFYVWPKIMHPFLFH